jgi:hypothetical protein
LLIQFFFAKHRIELFTINQGCFWLLATGYWRLATGDWLLVTGDWLLLTGYW